MSQIQNQSIVSLLGAVSAGNAEIGSSIGSVIAIDNAIATTITTQDIFVNINLGTSGKIGVNATLWSLSDAALGQLTYDGLTPFIGVVSVAMSIFSIGTTEIFQFQVLKNGSPLTDDIRVDTDIGLSIIHAVPMLVPITVVTGDTVRLRVRNREGFNNVTIQQFAMQVS